MPTIGRRDGRGKFRRRVTRRLEPTISYPCDKNTHPKKYAGRHTPGNDIDEEDRAIWTEGIGGKATIEA